MVLWLFRTSDATPTDVHDVTTIYSGRKTVRFLVTPDDDVLLVTGYERNIPNMELRC
jgi:hypothetical protein